MVNKELVLPEEGWSNGMGEENSAGNVRPDMVPIGRCLELEPLGGIWVLNDKASRLHPFQNNPWDVDQSRG